MSGARLDGTRPNSPRAGLPQPTASPDLLADARRIADAVLYEGYLLYPYRASSAKNQVRWQFGVLGPRGAAEAGAGEPAALGTSCLLLAGEEPDDPSAASQPRVEVHLRFLQVQDRQVEEALPVDDPGPAGAVAAGSFRPVDELRAGGSRWLSWQEAVEQEVGVPELSLEDLAAGCTLPIHVPGARESEAVTDVAGHAVGRLIRTREALEARLDLAAVPDEARAGLYRLELRVTNEGSWPGPLDAVTEDRVARRNSAATRSFVGTHLLLRVSGGTFVSVTDPPAGLEAAARACRSDRCWPVLVGPEQVSDPQLSPAVLAAPIILGDRPSIAPESPGDLFDATEIDEILTLRVQTLTDDEKAAARATDPRAATIVDRCDALTGDEMGRLHGARRSPSGPPDESASPAPWWTPEADALVDPAADAVRIAGVAVTRGSRVRLRPSRRADAQDIFLAGRTASVAGVHADVDGQTHVAVTLEDDPAADLHDWYGRYYYFGPEELEPLTPEADAPPGAGP